MEIREIKKILIAKVQNDNQENVMNEIMKLIDMANECRDDDVVKQMKFILPEYISNNSVYQLYDNKYTSQPTLASSV